MESEKLTFIHVIQAYDLPDSDQRSSQTERKVKDHIRWKVEEHLREYALQNTKVEIFVKKENRDAAQVVIDFLAEAEVDLTILGKKAEEERKEMYSERIMSHGESDMLLVPVSPRRKGANILMALDLSSQSERAFQVARKVAEKTSSEIACQPLFSLPARFFPFTGFPQGDSRDKKKLQKQMQRFIEKMDADKEQLSCYDSVDKYEEQGKVLMSKANATETHLVVIGAKGRTDNPSSLLGLVANQTRKYTSPVSILIVKS
jgi:nucleotide-binding universal stress UspA family protein